MAEDKIERLRDIATRIRENLPKTVDVRALGVMSKTPFQILTLREALIWRTDELLGNALDALDRKDFSVAAILTRALMENTALLFRLVDIFINRQTLTKQELNDQIMQLAFGTREWSDGPQAINILTCVGHADKKVEGLQNTYNSLSEYAHPNWKGVLGLYSKLDQENHIAYFGREMRSPEKISPNITTTLVATATYFEYLYNKISDGMPNYLAKLEPIWPEESAK
jgi:hypothetical protein